MSAAAIGTMVFVLTVVWGGATIALIAAWRLERRQARTEGQRRDGPQD
ncbi:MAG: hypothetical protein JXR96_08120 [Deltaproteobacteria bacterium]|nr:hypothetical protein [Deltaproteobacteria bacterium]